MPVSQSRFRIVEKCYMDMNASTLYRKQELIDTF
uniref:Uncharacterized protein n=1 Tax=Arundo donax TaxID=35708 RepID=A0A0A8Y2A8_ARUDO